MEIFLWLLSQQEIRRQDPAFDQVTAKALFKIQEIPFKDNTL